MNVADFGGEFDLSIAIDLKTTYELPQVMRKSILVFECISKHCFLTKTFIQVAAAANKQREFNKQTHL